MHTKAVSLRIRNMIRWHTLEQHTASYILPTAKETRSLMVDYIHFTILCHPGTRCSCFSVGLSINRKRALWFQLWDQKTLQSFHLSIHSFDNGFLAITFCFFYPFHYEIITVQLQFVSHSITVVSYP